MWALPLEHTSSGKSRARAASTLPSDNEPDAPPVSCFSVWSLACSGGAGNGYEHASLPTAASWGQHVSTAWEVDPQLAMALLDHFGNKPAIVSRLQTLVLANADKPRVQVRSVKNGISCHCSIMWHPTIPWRYPAFGTSSVTLADA